MTAEATIAAVNVKKEIVLSRLLLSPLHPSSLAVGVVVGVGVIWLLVLVPSIRNRSRDISYL